MIGVLLYEIKCLHGNETYFCLLQNTYAHIQNEKVQSLSWYVVYY